MIDWEKVAEQNGLTPEQFEKEILTCAAVVGAMRIDESYSNTLRFACSDEKGEIRLLIHRMEAQLKGMG